MIPPVQRLTLKDGRNLAYSIYGDPQGTPLLFFHGTPGSSQLTQLAERGAITQGFKLIAPDRPGIGDSDLQAGRELFHYPLDIIQLLDHLQLKQCGIIAISGGSPYAFQCAHDLSERIPYLASLSGWVSYGRPELRNIKIDPFFHFLSWASNNAAALIPPIAKSAHWAVHKKIDRLFQHIYHKSPPADRALLDDLSLRAIFLNDLKNAFKQGWEGVAREATLQFSNPLFDLAEITQPTLLMHGTADTIVPYAFAEFLRDKLPKVVAYIKVQDGGHLCAVTEQESIYRHIRGLEEKR